jgi:hypothetical protein
VDVSLGDDPNRDVRRRRKEALVDHSPQRQRLLTIDSGKRLLSRHGDFRRWSDRNGGHHPRTLITNRDRLRNVIAAPPRCNAAPVRGQLAEWLRAIVLMRIFDRRAPG